MFSFKSFLKIFLYYGVLKSTQFSLGCANEIQIARLTQEIQEPFQEPKKNSGTKPR